MLHGVVIVMFVQFRRVPGLWRTVQPCVDSGLRLYAQRGKVTIFVVRRDWRVPLHNTDTMIYLTQLVYLKEGQEEAFNQFEQVSIPLIKKYNGRLLLRLRPQPDTVIEATVEAPYEIHVVEFAAEADFDSFKKDKERVAFLHVKEQAIRSVLLIKGNKI